MKPHLPGMCPSCGEASLIMGNGMNIHCQVCKHHWFGWTKSGGLKLQGDPCPNEIATRAAEIRSAWPGGVQPGFQKSWSKRRKLAGAIK
jgi:hypothetical protein